MIKNELNFLWKNKLLLFVMAVIILIPSIYAGMFLSSMWDPYGEISKLPVAVVNNDVPVDYNGKTLSVGKNLQTSLESSSAMDFKITDEGTAKKGLRDGKYYMVITIPENFSKNASSMLDKNPKKMNLQYETNPGYNYISSKLGETAIKEIKSNIISEVTTTYTKAVFASISDLGDGFSKAADGTSKLLTGMDTLGQGAQTITDNLNLLADSSDMLHRGSTTVDNGMAAYLDGVAKVDGGMERVSEGTDKLAEGTGQLKAGSQKLLFAANSMKDQIDNGLKTENVEQINTASSSLLTMNDNIQKLNIAVNGDGTTQNRGIDISPVVNAAQGAGENMKTAGESLQSAATDLVGAYAATGQEADLGGSAAKVITAYSTLAELYQDPSLTEEQRNSIAEAMNLLYNANDQTGKNTVYGDIAGAVSGIKGAGENIQKAGKTLTALSESDMSGQLNTLKTSVDQLAVASDRLLPASSEAMNSLLSNMQKIQGGLGLTIDGMTNLNSGIESLDSNVTGNGGLRNGILALHQGSKQLVEKGKELKAGTSQITDGMDRLSNGTKALAAGAGDLNTGISALVDGTTTLNASLNDGAKAVADSAVSDANIDMFVTPLTTEETQITTVENNGHAMAAYMMSVGLWVGCLAFCLMYPLVEYRDKFKNGFSWFASKAVIVYPMAVVMGIMLYAVLHIVNGFNPVQAGNTILVSVMSAVCFMSIMYFFNALLGKVGSFFMLVFMVLQLAGSAGTYPIEISGNFAAAIHKYVPFTYTVNAFRSAISGGKAINGELGILAALTLTFVIFTVMLFLYRARRIESGKSIFYRWIEERGLA